MYIVLESDIGQWFNTFFQVTFAVSNSQCIWNWRSTRSSVHRAWDDLRDRNGEGVFVRPPRPVVVSTAVLCFAALFTVHFVLSLFL